MLAPDLRAELENQVEHALAKRSIPGAMVYFLVTVVIALSTPYFSDHPVILSSTAAIVLSAGIVRILASRRLLAQAPAIKQNARLFLLISLYITAIAWGAFCAATVHLYRRDWTAMFVLLNTAALAAGISSSLSPSFILARRYLVLMMAPAIVTSFFLRDPGYTGFAIMTAVYFGFLVAQTRSNWLAFWSVSVAAERERRQGDTERATLVAAIEQAAEEILITDTKGIIRYCNLAFERVTGYPRGEVIGRNPRFLKSERHDPEYYRTVWSTILEGRVWSGSFKNRRKDGSEYETEGTIAPIHDDAGKLTGFVSAWHDITERLRLESELRQAQKMESIGRLAGGVAHDFNNLLTVITGYGGLLDMELAPRDPLRSYVKEICRAGDRAASLTRQLLAFSRKQFFRPVILDLNHLIEQMQGMIQRLVGEDILVETKCGDDLPLVSADPDQISQILMNLAANARDAMPHGGRLTIRTARSSAHEADPGAGPEDARERALLAVSDTGHGIPEEIRQHLFEPFFTTKEPGRGTGLGLSTVYGIVCQSDGCIDVQSEPGKGTTFSIYLPAIEDTAAIARVPEGSAPAASIRATGTVLVVEDQDEVRGLVKAVLESEGFKVLEAAGGRAALSLALRHTEAIHLLITDLIMPEMTGKQVADELMTMRPEIKVLFISGYSGDILERRGVSEPEVPYLTKPFTPGALSARVHEVLGDGETAPNLPESW
jgi:two-component system, cell cycle sensor histidine kinase and response regulator CckA